MALDSRSVDGSTGEVVEVPRDTGASSFGHLEAERLADNITTRQQGAGRARPV